MNTKATLLNAKTRKGTHRITVGEVYDQYIEFGFGTHFGGFGNLDPIQFQQKNIIGLWSTVPQEATGQVATGSSLSFQGDQQPQIMVHVTRLDTLVTAKFIYVKSTFPLTSSVALFQKSDVGKTIDLIIEPV